MKPRKALLAAIVAFVTLQTVGAGAALSQTELEGKWHVVRCNTDGSYDCASGCPIGYTCC